MEIYDQSAVIDIEVRSELSDEVFLQILRELQSGVSGKIDTTIRLVITRDNVDFAIEKINELRVGRWITEQKKYELISGLQLFKTRRNGLSLM